MADALITHGYTVTPPATRTEGWFPERVTLTSAPTTTTGTAPKTTTITANSHRGQLLLAYADHARTNPGHGLTAAEAQHHASLKTNGLTGSPWHRVGDLKTYGLLTIKYDGTGTPMKRRNASSGRNAAVLTLTPQGRQLVRTLRRRLATGKGHLPVLLNPAPEQPDPSTKATQRTTPKRRALKPTTGTFTTSADHRAGQQPRNR